MIYKIKDYLCILFGYGEQNIKKYKNYILHLICIVVKLTCFKK